MKERMNDILISNEEESYIIYIAKNLVNNKVYIGATTKSLNVRKKEHLRDVKRHSSTRFHQSIATYGEDSFNWETIDTANNINDLARKEKEYIIKYDSCNSGLNIDSGGGFRKKVYKYDFQTKKLLNVYNSLRDAAKSIDTKKQQISGACLSINGFFKGFYWSYSEMQLFTPRVDNRKKKVIQFDLNGSVINEFKSVSEASKYTGFNKTSIAKVCRNERIKCGGFNWEYKIIK